MAGCQTVWTNFPGIPTCSDLSQLNNYITTYLTFMVSKEETQLINETQCLGWFRKSLDKFNRYILYAYLTLHNIKYLKFNLYFLSPTYSAVQLY